MVDVKIIPFNWNDYKKNDSNKFLPFGKRFLKKKGVLSISTYDLDTADADGASTAPDDSLDYSPIEIVFALQTFG